jgi:hypothetical protein
VRQKKPYSIIGLSKHNNDIKYYHCQIHQGSRLIPYPEEDGLYLCTDCGIPYNPNDTKSDTKITSRFGVGSMGTKITSGKNRSYKQKEYYDQTGNKINKQDPDVMKDIAAGRTVVYYHTNEDLNEKKDATYTVKR